MLFRTILPLLAAVVMGAAPAPPPPPIAGLVPPPEVAADPLNRLTLDLSNGGQVVILLRPDLAPAHVQRIRELAAQKFYDGLTFHRVIPGFMAQGGDPLGTGTGGSPLPDLKAEFTAVPFLRGTMGAARAQDPDSANSQFFIMFAPEPSMDGDYTVLGRVIAGMDSVDRIAPGEPPAEPTRIVSARIGS